jgi:transposase
MTEDCRKLSPEQQEEIRRRAVSMVQKGTPPQEVADLLGVAARSIFYWLARYRSGGWHGLQTGSRSGRPSKLGEADMRWIYETVTEGDPRQEGFPFALWTLKMIGQLIRRELGIKLSRWSLSRLLKQMGLSVQRPVWRAWQQDPDAVKRWQSRQFPALRAYAKRIEAKVYFADEAGIRSDCHAGTTWAERGNTPVVKTTGARFSCNMISAVSPLGELRFMVTDKRMNAGLFCDFLDRLMHGEEGKVLLVVDGHPSHKAKKVQKHLEKYEGRLKLYLLPGYSPELNPDELVWNWVKNHKIGKDNQIADKASLIQTARSALSSLQKLPETIRGFFNHPDLAYIKGKDFCTS